MTTRRPTELSVLGTPLKPCSIAPLTGFARDGFRSVTGQYAGAHGVCAGRWQEAFEAGAALKVVLAATSKKVLDSLFLDDLLKHAVDAPRGTPTQR